MDKTRFLLRGDNADPWELLPTELGRKAIGIRDYMIGDGRRTGDPNLTLQVLSEMFVAAGLPLDRCVTIVSILHAENMASMREWNRGIGTHNEVFPHGRASDEGYLSSPAALAHEHECWVGFYPQETADDTFGIVPRLKTEGFTHYVCAPVFLLNGMHSIFSFATKDPEGFSERDIAFLRATFPAIGACQEIFVVHRLLKEVTRMYVGEEPHERILAGDVQRGDVTRIRSAIFFADMRDFTSITSEMTAEETTALLNTYFDCLVPAIEGAGGEVLKFMGDGVLAIFRVLEREADATMRSLKAAREALGIVATSGAFEVGVALHFGEVAYGNVGSGMRLDYTVIGRDVNLASRIAGLCGVLEEPLLVSDAIKQLTPEIEFEMCGEHALKGFSEPQPVYSLCSARTGAT